VARKLQLLKAYYLLDRMHLSLGELQSHTTVVRVVKQGRKPRKDAEDRVDRRPIVKKTKIVAGTRIPASTLKKFQDRTITPRKESLKKLAKMHDRVQYQRLRAAGANYKDARKLKSYPPEKVQGFINNYLKCAKKIQRNYEQTYIQKVKEYEKQERDKLKPPKPVKPVKPPKPSKPVKPPAKVPEFDGTDDFNIVPPPEEIKSQVVDTGETYLDEEEYEDIPESSEPDYYEIKPPVPDDYPNIDEVIYGMSESDHTQSEWEDIAESSGLPK
jgi:hypothetical protein